MPDLKKCEGCNREFPRSTYYRHIKQCLYTDRGKGEKRKAVTERGVSWKRYKVEEDKVSENSGNSLSLLFREEEEEDTPSRGLSPSFSSLETALERLQSFGGSDGKEGQKLLSLDEALAQLEGAVQEGDEDPHQDESAYDADYHPGGDDFEGGAEYGGDDTFNLGPLEVEEGDEELEATRVDPSGWLYGEEEEESEDEGDNSIEKEDVANMTSSFPEALGQDLALILKSIQFKHQISSGALNPLLEFNYEAYHFMCERVVDAVMGAMKEKNDSLELPSTEVVLAAVLDECGLSTVLPKNYADLQRKVESGLQKLGRNVRLFEKYACAKCGATYDIKYVHDNLCKEEGFNPFPCPALKRNKAMCKHPIVEKKKAATGEDKWVPTSETFNYASIIDQIVAILQRENNLDLCEDWRKYREVKPLDPDTQEPDVDEDTILWDAHDGIKWLKLFAPGGYFDKLGLGTTKGKLALQVNMDFFGPFGKFSNYKVGAIYITILNLPISVRFQRQNVITYCVLPGPGEPEHINSFLTPLVEELRELDIGVEVSGLEVPIQARLISILSDLPASRKMCGCLSHSGSLGCHRCWFKAIYSKKHNKCIWGVPEDQPVLGETKDVKTHIEMAHENSKLRTAQAAKDHFSTHGAKLTALTAPYGDDDKHYNILEVAGIDPMHGVEAAVCKKQVTLWLDIFTPAEKDKLDRLSVTAAKCMDFSHIGRAPTQISKWAGSFKASQWRVFGLYMSAIILPQLLTDRTRHLPLLEYFVHFHKALRLLLSPIPTKKSQTEAFREYELFLRKFTSVHGLEEPTPYMHLCLHMPTDRVNFGAAPAATAYAYERYNGLMIGFPKSFIGLAKQLLKNMVMGNTMLPGRQSVLVKEFPENFQEHPFQQGRKRWEISADEERDSFAISRIMQGLGIPSKLTNAGAHFGQHDFGGLLASKIKR